MRLKIDCIKNKNIEIKDIDLDFSKYGIYIINGDNGVGKTTILNQIIFNKNKIEFNNCEQKESYNNDRYNLFTYIPQKILDNDKSVLEYITKQNTSIKLDDIIYWMNEFKLNNIKFEQKFNTLSGGEKVKISIISGLLKDTPYIFMDEPTNNLDDESVNCLVDIINKLSKDHTFVIVTHDPRFKFENYNKVYIEKNKVTISNHSIKNTFNNKKCPKNSANYLKLIMKLLMKKVNMCITIISLLSICSLIYFMNVQFEKYYGINQKPLQDIIMTYKSDYGFGDLNETYVKSSKLEIDRKNYYRLIEYDDIPNIANMEYVEKVIMLDREYIDNILNCLNNDSLIEKFNIISMPDIIQRDYANIMYWLVNDVGALKSGRLPRDNKNEISISEKQLKKYFNYNDSMIENAIGNTIIFDGKEYKIVGIQYNDISFLSYEDNNDWGFKKYNTQMYTDFKNKSISHKKKEEYNNNLYVDEMLIYTKKEKEYKVLNELIKKYSGENYYSYQFNEFWEKQINNNFVMIMIGINIIVSSVLGLILGTISKNQLYMNKKQLIDYSNYYISKNRIKYLYYTMITCQYLLILIVSSIVNRYISMYAFLTNKILIIDTIIVFIIIMYNLIKVKENDK